MLALAQLNRESEAGGTRKPRLSDLKGSGALEQDADVVLLLHRPDRDGDLLEVEVAKNRNGRTGEVVMTYDRARMRFSENYRGPFA